jgi:hypothetical protein
MHELTVEVWRSIELLRARVFQDEIKSVAIDRRSELVLGWMLAGGGLGGLVFMGLHGWGLPAWPRCFLRWLL